ncbi:hypothetical protein K1X76_12410 [bacterium]|nr:hypothetical protein [bacterium]
MTKKIISFLLLTWVFVLPAHAAFFAPSQTFYTVKTKHFAIHYEKGLESVANDVVEISEKVYSTLSPKYNWKPFGRTHLVLTDKMDQANGSATVLPANYIMLFITPPDVDSPLENYKNYLELLITHEFTHILHMDQHHGFTSVAHFLFGKIVATNGLSPGWMREGIASYEESVNTGYGRANFSYSDMMLRTSIYENNFPKIDQAAGSGAHFPAAERQYIYGVKFWQWLSKKYGDDKVPLYAKKYSSTPFLFTFNGVAKRVYGKSFYKLWDEWKTEIAADYNALKNKLVAEGITPFTPAVKDKDVLSHPTALPSGQGFAYSDMSPDEEAHLVIKKGGEPLVLKRAVYGQMSFSSDSNKVAFGSISEAEKYKYYSEVYVYDVAAKTQVRVYDKKNPKLSMRASDPDFAPFEGGNRWLVMVRTDKGTDNLYVYDLENKEGYYLTHAEEYTQFSNPRFSPDGSRIVVSQRNNNGSRDIVLYSRTGDKIKNITNDDAIDAHPVWSPEGSSIYYDSDKSGISNIYRYDVASGTSAKITNVLSGVYQPSISADGKTLYVAFFKTKGMDIYQTSLTETTLSHVAEVEDSLASSETAVISEAEATITVASLPSTNMALAQKRITVIEPAKNKTDVAKAPKESAYKNVVDDNPIPQSPQETVAGAKKYNAFPQVLVPRYIMPSFFQLDDAFIFQFVTGSTDPLYRHAWSAYATYRTDAMFLGGGLSYVYQRYNPSLFVGYMRYAYDRGSFFEERNQVYAGASYNLGNYQNVALSYFFEKRDNFSAIPAAVSANLGNYAGLRAVYTYSRFKLFPNGVSQEDGPFARLSADWTNSVFGSAEQNEQYVFMGDLRYYLEMPYADHHVLAFRAAGGWAGGDREASGSFRFGGPFGEGTLAGYSTRLFAFRGLPGVQFAGDRAVLFSTEYRFPIWNIERGLGTAPIFFQRIHGSVFSDFGNIWNSPYHNSNFLSDCLMSVGTELKTDLVVGYGLPLNARLGYAIIVKNRDAVAGIKDTWFGQDIRNGTFYFQLGTSF